MVMGELADSGYLRRVAHGCYVLAQPPLEGEGIYSAQPRERKAYVTLTDGTQVQVDLRGGLRVLEGDMVRVVYHKAKRGDLLTGRVIEIVKRAVEAPVRQIAENAGLEGSVVVDSVKKAGDGVGFNALENTYVDMIGAGIVDPAKVTRSALQNAASIAAMVLTTETLVTDKPEPEAPMPGGAPGLGGMGGMM